MSQLNKICFIICIIILSSLTSQKNLFAEPVQKIQKKKIIRVKYDAETGYDQIFYKSFLKPEIKVTESSINKISVQFGKKISALKILNIVTGRSNTCLNGHIFYYLNESQTDLKPEDIFFGCVQENLKFFSGYNKDHVEIYWPYNPIGDYSIGIDQPEIALSDFDNSITAIPDNAIPGGGPEIDTQDGTNLDDGSSNNNGASDFDNDIVEIPNSELPVGGGEINTEGGADLDDETSVNAGASDFDNGITDIPDSEIPVGEPDINTEDGTKSDEGSLIIDETSVDGEVFVNDETVAGSDVKVVFSDDQDKNISYQPACHDCMAQTHNEKVGDDFEADSDLPDFSDYPLEDTVIDENESSSFNYESQGNISESPQVLFRATGGAFSGCQLLTSRDSSGVNIGMIIYLFSILVLIGIKGSKLVLIHLNV